MLIQQYRPLPYDTSQDVKLCGVPAIGTLQSSSAVVLFYVEIFYVET